MARDFYCQCPNDEAHPCTAQITAPTEYVSSGISAKIVLYVIADQATIDGTADNPGFLNGHGVISADHVRDIAEHPDTVTRPIGNEYKAEAEHISDPAEPAWHNWEFLPDRDLDDPTFDPDPIDPYLEDVDDETAGSADAPTNLGNKPGINCGDHSEGRLKDDFKPAPTTNIDADKDLDVLDNYEHHDEVDAAPTSHTYPVHEDKPSTELDGHTTKEQDDVDSEVERDAETAEARRDKSTPPASEAISSPNARQQDETAPALSTATDLGEPRYDDVESSSPPSRDSEKTTSARRIVYARAPQDIPTGTFPEVIDEVKPPFLQPVPLPVVQPGDRYRPSAVLDSYLRIRDCYCTWPGCDKKAWDADLDHSREYNHDDPDSGGQTHPREMKALCRFHHLLKTYSDWLDDQYPDPRTGRNTVVFTTPEGKSFGGPAWTGEDLFPALARIIWEPGLTRRRPAPTGSSNRPRSRTAAKHARRQQERERNRRLREIAETTNPPPF
jgi:hypothetical protein